MKRCENKDCGELFEPAPRHPGQRYCKEKCREDTYNREGRKAKPWEEPTLAAALVALGDEERRASQWDRAEEPSRPTGKPRACSCNGNGIFDFDPDGSPVCVKCGGSVHAISPEPSRATASSIVWGRAR